MLVQPIVQIVAGLMIVRKHQKIRLVDVFGRSVEHLLNLNYLLGLLNRQNFKHELFAFTCNCRTLLLRCIVYQWIGPSSMHLYR